MTELKTLTKLLLEISRIQRCRPRCLICGRYIRREAPLGKSGRHGYPGSKHGDLIQRLLLGEQTQ